MPIREKLPRTRTSQTFEFRVADCKGFVTVGEYEDGRPGEIFIRVSKQGSTLAGIMDAFAISISHGLQYGVPLRSFVEAFTGMRFEPAGMTDDPDIRIATQPDRLPVPPAGDRVPVATRSGPSSASSPPASGPSPRCPASRRRSPRPARAPTSRPTRRSTPAARCCRPTDAPHELSLLERAGVTDPAPAKPSAAIPPQGQPQRRAVLHAVRRPDAAGRHLPRLPQLRQHQRLQLILAAPLSTRQSWLPSTSNSAIAPGQASSTSRRVAPNARRPSRASSAPVLGVGPMWKWHCSLSGLGMSGGPLHVIFGPVPSGAWIAVSSS